MSNLFDLREYLMTRLSLSLLRVWSIPVIGVAQQTSFHSFSLQTSLAPQGSESSTTNILDVGTAGQ